MPLYRHNGKLIYFAHIPKCGGISVESYLGARFGNAGFLNARSQYCVKKINWTRTSPSHALWSDFDNLVPGEWFDLVFGVVRHPVSRVVSAYNFASLIRGHVRPGVGISDWFRDVQKQRRQNKYVADNHMEPQALFLPEDAHFFRLEDGLEKIIPFIDKYCGNTDGPRTIAWKNKSLLAKRDQHRVEAFPADMAGEIFDTYADDFRRFGYERNIPDDLSCHVPLGKMNVRLSRFRSKILGA